ncbi:MAG: hypothetical protein ACHQRJ_13350 [Alphaproteobacteria bacterium]
MDGRRENELVNALADAVEQRLRTRLGAEIAGTSEAIAGLVAAQAAIAAELQRYGALNLAEARSTLERAVQALPAPERKSRKGGVLLDLARMLGKLETAFEAAGVELIGPGHPSYDGGAGVRLKKEAPQPAAGLAPKSPSKPKMKPGGARPASRPHKPLARR